MTADHPAAVVVLAAGGGTRMKSATPKVLHTIGGRSLVGHALAAAQGTGAEHLVVVVGHGREAVQAHVEEIAPDARIAVQQDQRGTGHAVLAGLEAIPELDGDGPDGTANDSTATDSTATDRTVVVTYGDVPLLTSQTLQDLVAAHRSAANAVTVLTAEVSEPFGYGRIVRDASGAVTAIIEEKDADDEQRRIREINSGIFAYDAAVLKDALGRVGTANAAGEMYLTDVVAIVYGDGRRVGAVEATDVWQTEGVNTRAQLAAVGRELNQRILGHWMTEGVEVIDPLTTWVDVTVELAPDVTLKPGVQLHGSTQIATGASIGPDTTLTDVTVGEGALVVRTHGATSVLGRGCTVGPFAYLRPGTVIGDAAKVGTFVETKNSTLEDGAKVPHLSYVGDATVGAGANVGAGTIFANFDGVAKHRTRVGAQAKTGSQNVFVAPVEIGDGAATGAGTVVRRDVPPGALAVSTGPQRHIDSWVLRKRAGSQAAAAALAAQAAQAALNEEAGQ